MTETETPTTVEQTEARAAGPPPPATGKPRWWVWLARSQLGLCILLVSGVLAYLLLAPDSGAPASTGQSAAESPHAGDVRVAGPRCICLCPDCPLYRKLQVSAVSTAKMTDPVVTVTGVVAASLRPGNGKGNDYWQFNSSELLTAFTDWQKAQADIAFTETQLAAIKQLADTKADAQQKLVERMKKLVAAGTDTEKDLAAAQADLIQAQIQGRKDVHEAETAVRLAQRAEAALARQLEQAGLQTDLLRSMTWDVDIVMADVPEGLMSRVKLGQGCEARFFGIPDELFSGQVRAISPVLSKERRSLRVLFAIRDPHDLLRPGMFADIGLGTDARMALLVPAEAVIHVGRSDYVLVREGSENWRVAEVRVGELHETGMEVLGGLRPGEQVAGKGAILLKPCLIEALQTSGASRSFPAQTSAPPKEDRS